MTKEQIRLRKAIRIANEINTLARELDTLLTSNATRDELISMGIKHVYNAQRASKQLAYRLEEYAATYIRS